MTRLLNNCCVICAVSSVEVAAFALFFFNSTCSKTCAPADTSSLTFKLKSGTVSTSPKLGPELMEQHCEKPGENKVDLQKRQLMSKKGSGGDCSSPWGQHHLILQCRANFRGLKSRALWNNGPFSPSPPST